MSPASPTRAEDGPAPRPQAAAVEPMPTSLESLLALSLCTLVLLALVAFMKRSSELSRTLAGLAGDDAPQVRRPRMRPEYPGAGQRPELIVLISIDTLRADRLELYGYGRSTAPHLTALGAEGVVFRTVGSQSAHTLSSHKSLFTGKYPATLLREETGSDLFELTTVDSPREFLVDTFSHVQGALAQGFRERGYRTAGFTDGAWMSREAGFAHGFDLFDDTGGGLEGVLPRGLGWLDSNAAQPAFLFLHTYDVHCPYTTREPYDSTFCPDHTAHIPLADKCGKGALHELALTPADLAAISDHYDGSILSTDAYLGRFFDELRTRGLYERALIIVTSDHGESLGERGLIGHGGLYLEQLRVPLIVKFPSAWGVRPAALDTPVELVDLLPTLFTLCGIATPSDLDGSSLLPILFRGVRGRDFLLAQTTFEEAPELVSNPAKRVLWKPGRWQVIHDVRAARASFFGLEHDPAGLAPHEVPEQEFPALMRILTDRPAPGRGVRRPRAAADFGPELQRELEALGYAGLGAGPAPAPDLR